jgi:purine-binding chemotaxis protein CheW
MRAPCVLVRAGSWLCALPIGAVAETMRPQPVQVIAGLPEFLRGVAVIRGVPTPVVDLASLLGQEGTPSDASRFVTLKVAERRIALAVGSVVGVRLVDSSTLSDVPPLLRVTSEHVVSAIATLDGELLVFLQSARLLSEETWAAIEAGAHQ